MPAGFKEKNDFHFHYFLLAVVFLSFWISLLDEMIASFS